MRNGLCNVGHIMGILRLSHVDITVPDLDLAAAYYTQVIGLDISERTDDRIFFKCWDERDHHCLAVRYHPRVGLDRFAFKVEHADDLATLERRVERYGIAVERVSKGDEVGQGESIRFETPSGHEMELVADVHKVGGRLPLLNPRPYPEGLSASPRPASTTCSSTPRRSARSAASSGRHSTSASPSSSSTAAATR